MKEMSNTENSRAEAENPSRIRIRDARPEDYDDMLALNQELVHFLSPLDMERLAELVADSAVCTVVELDGAFAGFLLGFREKADYDSINYLWFEANYPSFLYVDRVVISPQAQGAGLGAALYDDVFARAARDGVPAITAEYYVVPFNEVSSKFHERYGFREVGRQQTADGKKTVSLQVSRVLLDSTE